jgi:hypothetical protein
VRERKVVMGHIEKHLRKTDEELVLRLFEEWKLYSGCLFDNTENLIKEKLSTMKFNYSKQEVINMKFSYVIGFGYNRKLQKILSNDVKVVIIGNNENYEIITAYPDLDKGKNTGEYFLFKESMIDDKKVWNLFTYLYNKHMFDVRLILDKKPYVKISLHNYSIKIKNNKLTLIDSSYFNPKQYTFSVSENYTHENIYKLLLDIENFKETYSLFEKNTIENYVSGRIF